MSNGAIKRQASPKSFSVGQYAVNNWVHKAPSGVSPKDIIDPDYWAHVSISLRRFDSILVLAEDDSFEAVLRVTAVNRNGPGAEVRMISGWTETQDTVKSELPDPANFTVDFTDATRWRIVRKADNYVVKDKFSSKGEAFAHLAHITGKDISDISELMKTESSNKSTSKGKTKEDA